MGGADITEENCPSGICICDNTVDSSVTSEDDCDALDGDWDESLTQCEVSCGATTNEACTTAEGVWLSGMCLDSNGDGVDDTPSDRVDCVAAGQCDIGAAYVDQAAELNDNMNYSTKKNYFCRGI